MYNYSIPSPFIFQGDLPVQDSDDSPVHRAHAEQETGGSAVGLSGDSVHWGGLGTAAERVSHVYGGPGAEPIHRVAGGNCLLSVVGIRRRVL